MMDRFDANPSPASPIAEHYSPQRRTALVLTGTGTAGAYHAGVLRALHEAGVKLDIVAGNWGRNTVYELDQPATLGLFFGDWNSDGSVQMIELLKNT